MQAAYFLERLGLLRFEAEASRAKLYVDLQRIVNAGELTRACDLRGLLRAKEAEVVTLDRVAEAVLDRLIALRSRLLVSGGPTPIDGTTICGVKKRLVVSPTVQLRRVRSISTHRSPPRSPRERAKPTKRAKESSTPIWWAGVSTALLLLKAVP
jgi:hypothetical protein